MAHALTFPAWRSGGVVVIWEPHDIIVVATDNMSTTASQSPSLQTKQQGTTHCIVYLLKYGRGQGTILEISSSFRQTIFGQLNPH